MLEKAQEFLLHGRAGVGKVGAEGRVTVEFPTPKSADVRFPGPFSTSNADGDNDDDTRIQNGVLAINTRKPASLGSVLVSAALREGETGRCRTGE